MDVIDSGKMTTQRQLNQNLRVYERPELRELGTVEDLTWSGSGSPSDEFGVSS
jgi:hypothetical protein